MTPEDAEEYIAEILAKSGDPEAAHSVEDSLLWDFVAWQASLGDEVALEIQKAKQIDFPRWCA